MRLVPLQHVKPYVKRGKNYRNDKKTICEAAGRPGISFVAAKTVEQQAEGMVLSRARTRTANHYKLFLPSIVSG